MKNFETNNQHKNTANMSRETNKPSLKDGQNVLNKNKEKKEKLGKLAYYPIFRGNALYNAMFPDVEPLFQAGEEPNGEVVLQEVLKHRDKKIVMDKTTIRALYTLRDDTERKNENVDTPSLISELLKEVGDLDNMIKKNNEEKNFFSQEDAAEFVSLIKLQLPNVNRVILALDCINSHLFSGYNDFMLSLLNNKELEEEKKKEWNALVNSDLAIKTLGKLDEVLNETSQVKNLFYHTFSKRQCYSIKKFFEDNELGKFSSELYKAFEKGDFSGIPEKKQSEFFSLLEDTAKQSILEAKKSIVVPIMLLEQEIKNRLEIDLEFVYSTIDITTIDERTAIIFDRHNNLSFNMKLEEKIPKQTIIMPIDSGLEHANRIGVLKTVDSSFALQKRKIFEE